MNAMSNIVSLSEIKQRKMIAQYVKFYGTTYDSQRKATK
jgi:hypothetical protein